MDVTDIVRLFADKDAGREAGADYALPTYLGYDNPDEVFAIRGIETIDNMRHDDGLRAYLMMKRTARVATPGKFVGGKAQYRAFLEQEFGAMKGTVNRKLKGVLSAIVYGYSLLNIVRRIVPDGDFAGKIGLADLKHKKPHNYKFDLDKYGNILADGILFISPTVATSTPERLNRREFIHYAYNSEWENPYGESDCRSAYEPWIEKKLIRRFRNIYLERYAGGTLTAKYARGTKREDIETMRKIIKNLSARSGILFPDKFALELLEPSGRGAEVYANAIAASNIAMARSVLMPDLLGFSEKPTGSYALGKKHFDVFLWVLSELGEDLEESVLYEQIIKPLVDLNFEGPHKEKEYPRWKFDPLTDEQELELLAKLINAVEKGVVEVDEEVENHARKILHLPDRKGKRKEKPAAPPPSEPEEEPADQPPPGPTDPDDNLEKSLDGFASRLRFTRRLTTYERKVDFQGIVGQFDTYEEQFTKKWTELLAVSKRKLIEDVKRKKLVAERDIRGVEALSLSRRQDLEKSLAKYLLSGLYAGSLEAQKEVERGIGRRRAFAGPEGLALDLDKVGLDEVEKFFLSKGLVLTPAIKRAARELRRQAFYITGVSTEALLSQSKQILFTAIRKQDLVFAEVELARVFDGWLATGEVTDKALGTAHRVGTIARTNFSVAFNEGRRLKFEDPSIADYIVAYQYSSVLDDATTPYCEDMDGRILRKEEASSLFPPAHYSCRATLVPVTEGEGFKLDELSTLPRQQGFVSVVVSPLLYPFTVAEEVVKNAIT